MTQPDAIQDLARTKHIFWGLYGPPSAGKTRFISTQPNTLLIRPPIEHTESVRNPASNVKEWVISTWDEMLDDCLFYLRSSKEATEWDFVWLDSVSGWQDMGLDDVWEDTVALRPHRKKTPIDRGEYNANMTRLARWARAVIAADRFNFGFTAWPEELEDPETGKVKLMPWVQGKNMSNRFVGYMKLVTYLEKVERKDKPNVRVMRWAENDTYFIKDQFGLPDTGKLVNPTMPKMLELIEAARKPAQKTTARRRTRRTTRKKGSRT